MIAEDNQWYKDAIVYQLHVRAFFDSANDGVGDFRGLIDKLDYIKDLGVNAIWLLPFYPSPLKDDGYDIADYKDVNPSYGTIGDFRRFVREAHRRDLRVITELVMNHTSDQHPWFQRARHAKPGSQFRNFYVWRDSNQDYAGTRIIFNDTEKSNWSWDTEVNAYYWHRFFSHQPDLNYDNPKVVEAMIDVMRFWLDTGVDGLRLDAIPYLCERDGTNNENLPETHAIIRSLRAALDERHPGRMFLAEANQWPEDVLPYFGNSDECHMAFHFPLMPRMYMAVAQEDRHPITDIMRQTPEIPAGCQWAIFLRNHDELTLEMVTDRERDYLWRTFAADRRTRINLGIRRRLAPLLDGDRRKIELLNSLLMSMPGTPIIYYGDEIGMGDNTFLGDRNGVRTPMQWSPDRNAGFSRADPAALYLPPIMDPIYGYESVNVEAQLRSSSSLLNWMRRLIDVRREHRSFGRGSLEFLYPGNRKVFAYLRRYETEVILCVANLSRAPQPVELALAEFEGRVPIELLGRSSFPPVGKLPYFITLPAYGFFWFLLAEQAAVPSWHEPFAAPLPEILTLVTPRGFSSLMEGEARRTLERRILPEYLPNQRWFAGKGASIRSVEIVDAAELRDGKAAWLLALVRATLSNGAEHIYSLPLSIAWEVGAEDPLITLLSHSLARVRQGSKRGVLYAATGDSTFPPVAAHLMQQGMETPTMGGGRLIFAPTSAFQTVDTSKGLEVRRIGAEQSNTSILLGDVMVLKLIRLMQPGVHPEMEICHHLTEVAHFPNTPPLFGTVEMRLRDEAPYALAVMHGFVRNQGDGWRYTLEYLQRFLEEAELQPTSAQISVKEDRHGVFVEHMKVLGVRTAQLHRAFAVETSNPAFSPEPVAQTDLKDWRQRIDAQAEQTLAALQAVQSNLSDDVAPHLGELLRRWPEIGARIHALMPQALEAAKTRCHGDYHLGQVLVVKDDFMIIDFEGEPARTLAERRAKHCPLRDVAGMLRSFSYAGFAAIMARAAERPRVREALIPWVEEWERRTAQAFLQGYKDTIGDCASYPADAGTVTRLMTAFALEKALYEIAYEASNRPAWLGIPIKGLLDLIGSRET